MYIYVFLCFERIFLSAACQQDDTMSSLQKDVDDCGKRSYGWSDKSAVNYSYACLKDTKKRAFAEQGAFYKGCDSS